MVKRKDRAKNRLKTSIWALKMAIKIDWKMLVLWGSLSIGLSILPAVALGYNRAITASISSFLSTGVGTYSDVVANIVMLGIILTISGLSARVNVDLIHMMMYDSYYAGMQKHIMEQAQFVDLYSLQDKEIGDEYLWAVKRQADLTNFCSAGVELVGKGVGIVSLLFVAFRISIVLFAATTLYVICILILNSSFIDKMRFDLQIIRKNQRRADYFEKMPLNPSTAKEIRIYESYDQVVEQWQNSYKLIDETELKRRLGIELHSFISGAGFYILLILMLIYAVFPVANGSMSPAAFLMMFALCQNISTAVTTVTHTFMDFDYGVYGLERQRAFFDNVPKLDPEADSKKHDTPADEAVCYHAQNLTFKYKKGTPALDNISFQIKKGEIIALVGLNGSGKSTLAKVLMGLYPIQSGKLSFFGRPFADYKRDFITSKIGAFFQDFHIFHLTVAENIGIGDVDTIDEESRILNAAEKGGAVKLAEKLPKGIKTMLGREADNTGVLLSGGEKQRVGVSRAHMSDKDIMIFDEPASMLDPLAELEQFKNIKEKIQGRTAILISHRIGFARLADRVFVMDGGKVAEMGTHDELLNKDGIYANFFRQQAQWYDTENASGGEVYA